MPTSLPPLTAYVHFPWCLRKCPYCDFNSHQQAQDAIPIRRYLQRLGEDIEQDAQLAQGRELTAIFFGGGTPSLMSAAAISQILNELARFHSFRPGIEITLEANPGTFESAKFADFAAAGVNRLSIGVQSFQNQFLARLGRLHSAQEATDAIRQARRIGFDNFNIDLMHGLPGQDPADATADLTHAINLEPSHISWYQLTIEQNTEFYRQPPPLPTEQTLWDIHQAGHQQLQEAGFIQYEVSAFAHSGHSSQHNLNYWRYGDYLGLGPGAHGKITWISDDTQIVRTRKTRLPKDYLDARRPLVRLEEPVAADERPFDYLMNLLRLREPVSLRHFEQTTGLKAASLQPVLGTLTEKGLIRLDGHSLTTTATGYRYLNDVLVHWLD